MSERQFTTNCNLVTNQEDTPGKDHLPFSVEQSPTPLPSMLLPAEMPGALRETHGSETGCTLFLHLLSMSLGPASGSVMAAGCRVAAQDGRSVWPPLAHRLPQMSFVLHCVPHITWNHRFLDSFLQSGHLGSVL